jgi:hypothetical protein
MNQGASHDARRVVFAMYFKLRELRDRVPDVIVAFDRAVLCCPKQIPA